MNNIAKSDSVFASYNGSNIYGTDEISLDNFSKLIIKNASRVTEIPKNVENKLNVGDYSRLTKVGQHVAQCRNNRAHLFFLQFKITMVAINQSSVYKPMFGF